MTSSNEKFLFYTVIESNFEIIDHLYDKLVENATIKKAKFIP